MLNWKSQLIMGAVAGLVLYACGGNKSDTATPEEEDLYSDIVGDVDVGDVESGETEATEEQGYKGPTQLTVSLKVVNDRSPAGSYKLIGADGAVVVEDGRFGEPVEVKQGAYSIEFKSPKVFSEPVFRVDDVAVEGETMEVKETFPAGQIKLHTYKNNPNQKCKPVSFTVHSKTNEKDLPGKGKTCKPIILEIGTYELLLEVTKKIVQPVEIQVSQEQVSSAAVKLDR